MNSIKFIIHSLYVALFVVLLNSCEGRYGPFLPMPKEFKSYTVFPKDSYWIYKDSASARLDSIMEYNTYNHKLGGDWDSYYGYEDWIFYYNNNESYQRKSSLSNDYSGGHALKDYAYVFYEDVQQSGVYDFYPLYFNSDVPKGTFQYADRKGGFVEVTYTTLLSKMTIGTNEFTDVKVFEQSKLFPDSPATLTHRVYVAKDVGIIRRELFNGEVWELIKYHINN